MSGPRRALLALCLLAAAGSPSATLNTFISGAATAPVALTRARVPVLAGGVAELPCDTRAPARDDSLLLVVWYRDSEPLYSYDTRIAGPSAHWAEVPYAGRAQWLGAPASALRIRDVQPRDRADYRCRVDYHKSQTRNYKVALDVVELPSKPVIFDEYGKEVIDTAGPYREGSTFKLICTVAGGYPTPTIQWLQGDAVLATLKGPGYQLTEDYQPSRSVTLVVETATRAHLGATYTCAANNTDLAPPLRTAVQVDLYLKPRSVGIAPKEQPLSVGVRAELQCATRGAHPPALLSWWLGARRLDAPASHSSSEETGETQSLLRWTPLKEHNGQVLICRAEHSKFNNSSVEAKLPLNIYYVPEVSVHFGAKVNPNDIEEGDDVYFECRVDANPAAYKVVWEHDGVPVQHSPPSGVVVTGSTHLALRNVSRLQGGLYSCAASNVEGDGRAPPLRMRVLYKPLCVQKEMRIIGAALEEPATIACEVDAHPPPDIFEWTLNNSAGSHAIEPKRFSVDSKEGRSWFSFKPSSEADYGTLSCRASNLAGRQASPCVYTLLPATAPDAPRNCTVYNLTEDALHLFCSPGYEGGLRCTYVAEVWAGRELLRNATSESPSWSFHRLSANEQPSLKILVYAANAKGRSARITFTVEVTLRLSSRTRSPQSWEPSWQVGMFLGASFTVFIILSFAAIAVRLRHRPRDFEAPQKVMAQKRNSLHSLDDKNPDLIPFSKGPSEASREPAQYSAEAAPTQARSPSGARGSPLAARAWHPDCQNEFGRAVVRTHREIVTTRTPLLASQQESRV